MRRPVAAGQVALVDRSQDLGRRRHHRRIVIDGDGEVRARGVAVRIAGGEIELQIDVVFGAPARVIEHILQGEAVGAGAVIRQMDSEHRTAAAVADADQRGAAIVDLEVDLLAARRERADEAGWGRGHRNGVVGEIDRPAGEHRSVGGEAGAGDRAVLLAAGIATVGIVDAPVDVERQARDRRRCGGIVAAATGIAARQTAVFIDARGGDRRGEAWAVIVDLDRQRARGGARCRVSVEIGRRRRHVDEAAAARREQRDNIVAVVDAVAAVRDRMLEGAIFGDRERAVIGEPERERDRATRIVGMRAGAGIVADAAKQDTR